MTADKKNRRGRNCGMHDASSGKPGERGPHHKGGARVDMKTATEKPPSELMTDKEVCEILRISPVTLRKHLRDGPARKRHRNAGDIRLIRHLTVGGKRRWPRSAVMNFIHGN